MVVFVVFQTGASANGGVESITQVLEHLTRVRPVVVTQIETPVNERWRRAGIEVRVWSLPYRMGSAFRSGGAAATLRRALSFARTNARMRALVRETGARVVHCNDLLALLHTAPGAKSAGARVVQNVRDTLAAGERYGARWRWAATRAADRTVVLSDEMRAAFVSALGVPGVAERVEVIPSVVDFRVMAPAGAAERAALRERLGIAPGELAIGYVAGFNPKKAQLRFLEEGAPALRDALPGARVHFVGDFDPEGDPYAAACREAVRARGVEEAVRFAGYSPRVADWYRALDLVVLASAKEGLARCMIEALACATPVVSFDVCSAREVLEGNACGIVARQGDYPALVAALAALGRDPEARRAMGERGAEAARRLFRAEANVGRYEELYRALGARPEVHR